MPIRVTGLNSGLDTDSIVQELVSAYRVKGDKIKKEQTKLSWTQDKWKALNTKVVKLYKSLDNMRFTAGYNLKKTTVSDSTKAVVTAGKNALNGSHSLKINRLAKSGNLTGAQLKNTKGSAATVSSLGGAFTGTGTYRLSGNGVTKDIEITSDTTISDFVKQINDSGIGAQASYDDVNKRIFITSKSSGADSDFTLAALDANGAKALTALGVNVSSATSSAQAASWMKYTDASGNVTSQLTTDLNALVQAKTDQQSLMSQIEGLQLNNIELSGAVAYANSKDVEAIVGGSKENASVLSSLANMSEDDRKQQEYVQDTDASGNSYYRLATDQDTGLAKTKGDVLFNQFVAGRTLQVPKTDDQGSPVVDDQGNPVMEDTEIFRQMKAYNSTKIDTAAYEADANNSAYVSAYNSSSAQTWTQQITQNNSQIDALNAQLEAKAAEIEKYKVLDSDALTQMVSNGTASAGNADFDKYAADLANSAVYFAASYEQSGVDENGDPVYQLKAGLESKGAKKVDGTDALIEFNGVEYTSATNTFNINDLTIQAQAITGDDELTITTATDTQGLYDKIKDFLTEYNAIISEMSSLYNAESSKGYEPLTSEEKEAMSESEISDWEKKIKDSLLRRDSTLGGLITTMTSAMSSTVEINGKKYSLASLGIKTESYFNTTAATRYMYHIDGDADDDTTMANTDKLMAMLNSDPDTAIEIIKGVTGKLYDGLSKKMSATTMRSYQTIYNDKQMAINYSDYTKKISAWEEKVSKIEESYYQKFAAMEQALSKLQSQQSALAGLLGS